MREKKDREFYVSMFLQFSDKVELWFRKALLVLLCCLILFQALLTLPAIRHFMASAEKYEGTPIRRAENR
ncbi:MULTISPECIES: hypothetical protein [Paenibacillus]|uniref:hypothetical protein n=1 Tax=Paenibacillus TaxID=44249 RepID=UPI002FDF5DA2